MILIFCFNNLFEVLKKFFWCSWGYDKYIIMADVPKALNWNPIKHSKNIQVCRFSVLNALKRIVCLALNHIF